MPIKPARPCAISGCPALTTNTERFCDAHLKQRRQQSDAQRGTSTERGYDVQWRRYRRVYLAAHPLCALCAKKQPPVVKAAIVVDHIVPHRGDYNLFWDTANHQAACAECHNIKTAKEDGAFGNPLKGRGI